MNVFAIESYGARLRVESNRKRLLERARALTSRTLLGRFTEIEPDRAEHVFRIIVRPDETTLDLDGEIISQNESSRMIVNYFETRIRLAVGEFAKDVVFVHAGVVEHNGHAIVLPGNSYSGKTTLVSELMRNGAGYMSDEYAIFDTGGMVHSFPRPLSFRDHHRNGTRKEIRPESLGRLPKQNAYPVSAVVFAPYEKSGEWQPEQLSAGDTALRLIEHTLPIRTNTKFVLETLRRVTDNAICCYGVRGEAKHAAGAILRLFDNE